MRRALIAVTLVGLLALVALGSRSRTWGGDDEQRDVSQTAINYAVTLGLIVFVAMMIAAVIGVQSLKGKVQLERTSGMKQVIFFMAVLTVIGYFGLQNARWQRQEPEEEPARAAKPGGARDDARLPARPRRPELQWWLIVLAGAGGVAGVILYRRKPRRAPRTREEIVAEQLTAVLSATLEDLEFEHDPRLAVIQAYARMEAVLGAHGLPREPHEAPLEYLARVLRELNVRADAAHALTELFERAKFSRHEIDVSMKQEAIDALETVRDDLRRAA